ncbi:MAG: ATP-binding cassette domain-containing protein, partial [Zoogloeaceae bacterium]|nr:ATP-binding cassette domain-containing protein [Zoogloeaceae bacterium]
MTPPMIRVRQVVYDYPGHRALDEVSFDLPAASVTALVGPNGAGKTTLLRSMAALEEPMYGRIVIDGLDIWENPRLAHRLMGYLPDHFGLYQELSAWQCLLYAAWARGMKAKAAEEAAWWAAGQVELLPQLKMLA